MSNTSKRVGLIFVLNLSTVIFTNCCAAFVGDPDPNIRPIDPTAIPQEGQGTVTYQGFDQDTVYSNVDVPTSPYFAFNGRGGINSGAGAVGGQSGGGGGSKTPSDQGKDADEHKSGCATGNPVIIATGNKVKPEVDFTTHHLYPVQLKRSYSHNNTTVGIFGPRWASTFDPSLAFTLSNGSQCLVSPGHDATACLNGAAPSSITATRSDGSQATYVFNTSTQRYQNHSVDANDWFTELGDHSFQLVGQDGRTENYSPGGLVTSIKDPTGIGWTYAYSSNYLQTATHTSGLTVKFSWTGSHVTSVTDPAGKTYTYAYNSNGYLTSVTYPSSPIVITRTYFYENASLPEALTGIAVNNIRYSTYSYYSNGQVNTSGLLDGSVEKDTFVYGTNTTQVTNAAGAVANYTYQTFNGDPRLIEVDRSGVTDCANSTAKTTYDSNGHPAYSYDQRGIETTYNYSTNGFLQDIVTGISSSYPGQQREIQTTWDFTHNRITNINQYGANTSSPISSSVLSYYPDSSAAKNRLQSIVTTNLTSNGSANQTQTTSFSYQFYSSGIPSQIATSGPMGTATANYDSSGNLTSLVDALGHSTTYSGYNGLGLPSTIVDPNGFTASYTYDSFGHVLTYARTLESTTATTTYFYDNLGNFEGLNYPGGGYKNLNRDAIGRLTTVSTDECCDTVTRVGGNGHTDDVYETITYNNLSC